MNVMPRMDARDAEIVVCNKGGRDFRFDLLERDEEVPREFFYGFLDLRKAGLSAAMMSSAGTVPGVRGGAADLVERGITRALAIGVRPMSAHLRLRGIPRAKVVISHTDGFSLSLGLAYSKRKTRIALIGGFQGLSDMEMRAPRSARGLTPKLIRRALKGLDHVFFLSPADRGAAIERYGLRSEDTSILTFGVDTDFWRPVPNEPNSGFVFAIGHDQNRDFDCLAAAPGEYPTHIVTSLPVRVPPGADHVTVGASNFSGAGPVSDVELRRLYSQASAVVVPLRDVYQPTGQSVTLQAMSCGAAVILSRIKGLWSDKLRHEQNCILVPPGDAAALGAAIGRVRGDPELAQRLGIAARQTALAHFGLDKLGAGVVALARLGLAIYDNKNHHFTPRAA